MIIVLEGPDNAGKTTLARKLRHQLTSVKYYHPGGKPDDSAHEAEFLNQQSAMFRSTIPHIIDRVTCISQQVYNPDPVLDHLRQQMAAEMIEAGVVVIYCRPPNEVLMDTANFSWRAEETEEHRQKIITRAHEFIERYDKVMTGIPCISYDWRDAPHAELIAAKAVQALLGVQSAQEWFKNLINLRG